MTWSEWCASSYNTGTFVVSGNYIYFITGGSNYVQHVSGGSTGYAVAPSETIIADGVYGRNHSSGGID